MVGSQTKLELLYKGNEEKDEKTDTLSTAIGRLYVGTLPLIYSATLYGSSLVYSWLQLYRIVYTYLARKETNFGYIVGCKQAINKVSTYDVRSL